MPDTGKPTYVALEISCYPDWSPEVVVEGSTYACVFLV